MGLRDKIKQRIKSKATSESIPSGGKSKRGRQGTSRSRARAAELRAQLEALDAGENPQDEDDVRSQAARAEEVATMTAPVNARLDPIDVPHPFEGDQRGRQTEEEPTMEDLVLGRRTEEKNDDDTDSFFGGL